METTVDPKCERACERSLSGRALDGCGGAPARPAAEIDLTVPTARAIRDDRSVPEVGLDFGLRAKAARVLLLGGVDGINRRLEADLLGVDPGRRYMPFRAKPCKGYLLDEVASDLQLLHGSTRAVMPVAEHEGDLIGLLPGRPDDVESGIVGVGPREWFDNLADSFQLASRAVDAATAFGLTGVHEFEHLGVLPTIVADTDIGNALRSRYLEPVLRLDDGHNLVTAVECWLGNEMHVAGTAAALALHPNTLRNRIARFEMITGADLRDATHAMQVWWALQYVAMVGTRSRRWSV